MATVGVVKAIVTADVAQLKKGMNEAQRSLDNFSKNAKAVGKSMTMKVTAPLVGMGVAAGKMASDFEFSMTQIETLVGRTAQEVDTLKGSVLGLSGETGRAPKELADAMFFITSAGLDATSATAALEASAKAAAVGLGDTVVVADAVTNAMNGYGMSADGAAYATDVLAKTVEQGKASAQDLAPQFGRLIPMAAELGISFDQVGGGLAFLTRASGDAAMSATQFGGVMKSILKPSQQAKKTLAEIGVDLGNLRAAASEDLLGALQMLRKRLEENGMEMSNVFEDVRGLNGALQLTGVATNAARQVMDELANSAGKLDEAFIGVQKTAKFKISTAMAEIKAAMITLGEQILPVVIPLVKSLAKFIGDLARMFGSLPSGVQKTIVVLGVVAAAVGPLIWAIGSLTGALQTLGIVSANVTISMSAILPVIGLVAAAAAGLFMWWNKVSAANKKNKEEMEMLRTEYLTSQKQTQKLADRVKGLAEQYDVLTDSVEDTEIAMDHFKGKTVLTGQLLERDVMSAFNKLTISTELLEKAVKTGTDAFDDSLDVQNMLKGTLPDLVKELEGEEAAVIAVAQAVKNAYDNNVLTLDQAKDILRSIDETADAHDKLTETLNEEAEATFKNAEQYEHMASVLGTDVVDSAMEAAEASGEWDKELSALEPKLEKHNLELKREAALAAEAAAELDKHQAHLDAMRNGYKNVSSEMGEAKARLNVWLERLDAGVDIFLRSNEELEELATSMRNADTAMMQSAQRVEYLTEAEENHAYWVGVVADQRAKEAKELAHLEAKEVARQDALERYGAMAEIANANRLEAEKAIAEAAAREKEIKSEALRLANKLKSANAEVVSLEEKQNSLLDERASVLKEIEVINDEIAELIDLQNTYSAENADWADRIARNWHAAQVTILDLEEKVKELTEAVDAVPPDTNTQREFVNKLRDQRHAVNTVEQALIDMNVIKEEDAGFTDLTAAEAQALVRLQNELQETQLDMEAGEATVLDLMAAEEAWTEGLAKAREASRELTKAEEDLIEMQKEAIEIEKEQKRAVHELAVAQYDLAEAKKIGTKEEYIASEAAKAKAKIDEQLNQLEAEKISLQEQANEILKEQIKVDEDLRYAKERVASVMAEINDLGLEGQDIFEELMKLIHATTGEFRELIELMKNKGGGGGGGGTPSGAIAPSVGVTASVAAAQNAGATAAWSAEAQPFFDMLANLSPKQLELATDLYHDVERERGRAMLAGHSWGGSGVTVNVQGSVISEADLTNAINLAMQDITNSGGTGPSYAGLGSYVDFGET